MQKSFRTTLILLGACALLLGWYLVFEKRWRPEAEKKEEQAKQLVSLGVDQVQLVEIERLKNAPADGGAPAAGFTPQYETIKLKKSGADWTMTAPIEDAADAGVASSVVDAVVNTKHERVVDEKPEDLQPFGLKDPYVRVTVRKDSNDAGQTVLIGANTPVGSSSYAKVASSKTVVRVPRSMRTSAEKTVSELRDKSVLRGITRADVGEIEVQAGRENFIVKKQEGGGDEWLLARENLPADGAEWGKTLGAIIDLKATDFPGAVDAKTPNHADRATTKAKITLTRAKDKSRVTLVLSHAKVKDKEYVYAKRSDKNTLFEVSKDVLETVTRPASKYRSLTVARFNRYDVKKIRLDYNTGAGTLELTKDDKNVWNVTGDAAAKIDGSKVETLMTKLQDAKIDSYQPAGAAKLGDKAPFILRLFEKSGTKPEVEKVVLRFGRPKMGLVNVERADLPIGFYLKEADLKNLALKKNDFLQQKEEKKAAAPEGGAKKNEKAADVKAVDPHPGHGHDHDHGGNG